MTSEVVRADEVILSEAKDLGGGDDRKKNR
jgi:hypothetical protein